MAKALTKKAIKEGLERIKKATTSPKEKLRLLKEMNRFVKKADTMVQKLILKTKKEVR